ncbi:MAG: GNAT family N-acetyltransferase [Planctomycetes bacterium]|nr:GNAT family N-acetyltransferase [Planctomycetota bacterium]
MTAFIPIADDLVTRFVHGIRREEEARLGLAVWEIVHYPYDVRIRGTIEPVRRIAFGFDRVVLLMGPDPWPFFDAIPIPPGEIDLCFDPDLRGEVEARFRNLRLVDSAGLGRINRFLCLECAREEFRPSVHEGIRRAERLTPGLLEEMGETDARLREFAGSPTPTFVCRDGGRIVSRAPAPHITIWDRFSFAVIRSVVTLPVARAKGFASACVSALCRHLYDAIEVRWIYLWVEEENEAARRIYRNLGFREAGRWCACAGFPRRRERT